MSTTLVPKKVETPTESPDEVSVVLERAADLLEEVGWVPSFPTDGKLCVTVAIHKATNEYFSGELTTKAWCVFTASLGLSPADIVSWNDAQTDACVVIRALREAAAGS